MDLLQITEELLIKLTEWKNQGFNFWIKTEEHNYKYIQNVKKLKLGDIVFNLRISLGDEAFTLYIDKNNVYNDWEKEIILLRIADFKQWYEQEIAVYEEKYGKYEE